MGVEKSMSSKYNFIKYFTVVTWILHNHVSVEFSVNIFLTIEMTTFLKKTKQTDAKFI